MARRDDDNDDDGTSAADTYGYTASTSGLGPASDRNRIGIGNLASGRFLTMSVILISDSGERSVASPLDLTSISIRNHAKRR